MLEEARQDFVCQSQAVLRYLYSVHQSDMPCISHSRAPDTDLLTIGSPAIHKIRA